MDKEIERLQRAVETENWNYRKFRGQWEDAKTALDKYQNGALEVLTRFNLAKEFYWKEIFWGEERDDIQRVKIVIEFMAEALLSSRKKIKELEAQLRLYRAETPEERRKEVDDSIRRMRQYDPWAPREKDILATMTKHIRSLQKQIRTAQEVAEYRNKQLAALHVVWCDGGCGGGVGCRDQVTEEVVKEAERNVARLRTWWDNHEYKAGYSQSKSPTSTVSP